MGRVVAQRMSTDTLMTAVEFVSFNDTVLMTDKKMLSTFIDPVTMFRHTVDPYVLEVTIS